MNLIKRIGWLISGLVFALGMPVRGQEAHPEAEPAPTELALPEEIAVPEAPVEPAPAPVPPQPRPRRSAPPSPGPELKMPTAGAQPLDKLLEIPMNFQGTPVQAVVEFYGRLTGRAVIQAPNIQGQIWFSSAGALTVGEAIQALDTVLAINGIAVVPMGEKFLKVVQIATAKQEGLPVGVGDGRRLPHADGIITQIIPLQYADAAEVMAALQPYMHSYGQMIPLTKSNSLLITETAANINQMLEIVKYVDQPSQLRMQTMVYVIKHAKAAEVVQRLQSIIQEAQQIGAQAAVATPATPQQPGQPVRPGVARKPATERSVAAEAASVIEGKVIITPDERTNKIFVLSRVSNLEFFERLIAELDAKVEPDVITKVMALDYANAEDTAALLSSLISGGSFSPPSRGTGSTQPPGARTPPSPVASPVASSAGSGVDAAAFFEYAEGVRVLPDPRTNSLLLMATRADMERIEKLVRSVDTAVAQVLVEVVIAEVKLDGTLEVGVDLFKRLMREGQTLSGGGTRNLGDDQEALNLQDVALPAAGAFGGGLTYFLTMRNTKLDAVVRLLASSSRFKVLSTPIIQTLHNKEASIIVGESRPVPTSTISDATGSGVATRATIEFKDIAIELKVLPRINPDGYVTMQIEQKVNDFAGNVTVAGVSVPIITKREAKAEVAVRNESTIVLGGLIREDKNLTESRVPILGDIPVLGLLFKKKSNTKNRTELIVFLRPTVLRNDLEAVTEARRRRDMLKAGKELDLENAFEGRAFGDADTPAKKAPVAKRPAPEKPVAPPAEQGPASQPTKNFGPAAN